MRALVFVLLVACNKAESVATTAPSASASSVAASASSSAAVADAAPSSDQELVRLTQRWSDALARRDAGALDDVYAAHVTMYGTTYDRAAAIAAKKSALAPDYTQSIASVLIVKTDPNAPRAVFDKTWTIHGKESHVRASLGFAKEGARWRVADETDVKTEAKLGAESCLGLVHEAVLSTDDGKYYRGKDLGTIFVCGPPSCETFQIAGIHLDDQGMQRMASFDVDQKTGVVSHASLVLKADPAIVARMKAACAREAREDAQGK